MKKEQIINCPSCHASIGINLWVHPTCPKCHRHNAVIDGKCRDCGSMFPNLNTQLEYYCPNCKTDFLAPTWDNSEAIKVYWTDKNSRTEYSALYSNRTEAETHLVNLEKRRQNNRDSAPTTYSSLDWMLDCEIAALRLALGIAIEDKFFQEIVCEIRARM